MAFTRFISILAAIILTLSACSSSKQLAVEEEKPHVDLLESELVTEYMNSITADELKEMLYVFSSDDFEGRETGTRGQKKAANFLAKKYFDISVEMSTIP